MRPIDADALIKSLRESFKELKNICLEETDEAAKELREAQMVVFVDVILRTQHAPTLDLAPVVHGEWEERTRMLSWCDDDVDVYFVCSACNEENYGETPFCPNCGAKMDGGKKI